MKMTFRWYGEKDCIPLSYIKQIQGMTGVVTAVYDVPVGEVWDLEKLVRLKELAAAAGLETEVIESIPVHEDIKLGRPTRDKLIANYAQNIINCGKIGAKCVCYNFMPVFDWFVTNTPTVATRFRTARRTSKNSTVTIFVFRAGTRVTRKANSARSLPRTTE